MTDTMLRLVRAERELRKAAEELDDEELRELAEDVKAKHTALVVYGGGSAALARPTGGYGASDG
jgi:DNA-binding MurR/RpiR family transcriptional regulator